MKLKLKENPREWQKFTAVMMLLATGIGFLLHRRGVLSGTGSWIVAAAAAAVLATALLWPRPFRGFYRAGMTASYHVGRVMGGVLLTVLFLVVVTPLGLLLRLAGKDLLQLRRQPEARSYWRTARTSTDFEKQF